MKTIEDFESYCRRVGAERPALAPGLILCLLALWAIGGVR